MNADSFTSPEIRQLRSRLEEEGGYGHALLSSLAANPVCTVQIEDTIPCLRVTWKRYVTSVQLRYVHECLLELLVRHGCAKILGVDTLLPSISGDDQRWIAEDWLPRARAAGLKVVANKSSDSYFARIAVDSVLKSFRPFVDVRSFDDLERAREWLKAAQIAS